MTAVILLLPIGGWGAFAYSKAYPLSLADHGVALALIIALHIVIVAHVLRRRARLVHAAASVAATG